MNIYVCTCVDWMYWCIRVFITQVFVWINLLLGRYASVYYVYYYYYSFAIGGGCVLGGMVYGQMKRNDLYLYLQYGVIN